MKSRPKVSAAIFAATLLSFLLPFISVSCGGQKIATFSGVQLATGTSVDQPQMFGPPQKKNFDPEPLVVLAAVCAVVGLVMSLVGNAKAVLGPAISGGAGALLLLLLKVKLDDQIVQQGRGVLQLSYEPGYGLALLLLIAAAAVNVYAFFSQRKPSVPAKAGLTASPPRPALGIICPHCGAPEQQDSKFCAGCGKPLSVIAATGQ